MRIQLSGCAIINEKQKLLLLWKKKHQHYEFPGGTVEKGETLKQTAIRECKEELGVDVILSNYRGYEDFEINERFFRGHIFLGLINKTQIPKVNEPDIFEKLIWLSIEKYKEYSCASNVQLFCKNYLIGKLKR